VNSTQRKELAKAQSLVAEAASIVRANAEAEQAAFDEMSEKAQEGEKGQQTEADASALSELADTLEEADSTFENMTATE
jgi:hypothetical protein